jgi:hypothetical protein
MTPVVLVVIVLGLFVLVGVLMMATWKREQARTARFGDVALSMGLSFEPRGDLDQLRALADLPLYDRGHSRRARNVVSGRLHDDRVTLMDYRYTVGSGKHQKTHAQTVVVFPGAAHHLPDMQISPENFFHVIGQVFGYQDIDFESNPEFSKRYLVRGPDETAIRAALQPGALSLLASLSGWAIEVRSGSVGVYRPNERTDPDATAAFLDEAHGILRGLRG